MRLVLAILLLASIASRAGAQSQLRISPWDEMIAKGVLRTGVWTVSRVPLVNGVTACEATSLGHNTGGNYAIRIRSALPNPLLIISRDGQPFYKVHEIKLTLDDTDLATLPIASQQSVGVNQGVFAELTEPEFDQMVARMNAGRVLTALVGLEEFSAPVMRFNDVIVALGQCDKQHEVPVPTPKS